MSINEIKFPWEYTKEEIEAMPESVSEHGKCVGYRQDTYHDVHIFEDGHEERLYIGD